MAGQGCLRGVADRLNHPRRRRLGTVVSSIVLAERSRAFPVRTRAGEKLEAGPVSAVETPSARRPETSSRTARATALALIVTTMSDWDEAYLDTSHAVPSLSASRFEFARYPLLLTCGL